MKQLGRILKHEIMVLKENEALRLIRNLQKYEIKALAGYCLNNKNTSAKTVKVLVLLKKVKRF